MSGRGAQHRAVFFTTGRDFTNVRAIFHDMSTRALLAAALIATPAFSQAPAKSLPQHIADDFITLAGGVHPGYRINHAKGIVLTGTFVPSSGATAVSRAPH